MVLKLAWFWLSFSLPDLEQWHDGGESVYKTYLIVPSDVNNFKSFWTKEVEKSVVFYRIVHLKWAWLHDMAKIQCESS